MKDFLVGLTGLIGWVAVVLGLLDGANLFLDWDYRRHVQCEITPYEYQDIAQSVKASPELRERALEYLADSRITRSEWREFRAYRNELAIQSSIAAIREGGL